VNSINKYKLLGQDKKMNIPSGKYPWLLAVILASCFFTGCENNEKDLPGAGPKKTAVEELKQVITYYSRDAKVKAKLSAPYMLRNIVDSPYTEFPRTLHVDFYNDSLVIESMMDALYAKYRESENKVFLRDSVVVKNILKGDTLHCKELWWDQKSEKFYTDKAVRINKKGGTVIYGIGMEAPQDFSGYTILQVTGPLAVPQNGLPR
jgi:LPS export ABC transporter protein LptC